VKTEIAVMTAPFIFDHCIIFNLKLMQR
jgi:hypothetical protein